MPFFPRILEHLVGLDRRIGQRCPIQLLGGPLLEAMSEFEQLRPAAPQLAGQLGGGDALGDAAEDQDQLDRPPLGPLKGGLGEAGADAPAGGAAIGQDRGAVAAMDLQVITVAAVGAGQAVGMEQADEELVAGRLVHQLADREVHGRLILGDERLGYPQFNRWASPREVACHPFPDMSQ